MTSYMKAEELKGWMDYFQAQSKLYDGWSARFDAPTTLAAMLPPGAMFCPTCGTFDCPACKNASAMCPGPAP
jgi:hypothetical protein